ncbi:MAG: hypothetical protein LCH61_19300, partial [Proteobacteria bacterium]|nr:hypothetical protein [Pseudomonadota bacterium]
MSTEPKISPSALMLPRHDGGFGPSRRLHVVMLLALLLALTVIATALTRPWSGLEFAGVDEQEKPWRVTAVAVDSPAAQA